MRVTLKRLLYALACLILLAGVVRLLKDQQPERRRRRRPDGLGACKTRVFQTKLNALVARVHKALDLLQVTHFLCHESLWAAMYNEGARGTDSEAELCIVDGPLAAHDEGFLRKMFRVQGLEFVPMVMNGDYIITQSLSDDDGAKELPDYEDEGVPAVRLIVFEKQDWSSMMVRRKGFKRKLLPADCEIALLECFPSQLADPPLSSIKYGDIMLPSPREGLEIQKYHYPDDWWLQRKVHTC